MQLRSLAQMRSKVVFEADLPPPTSATTPSLADINSRINEGVSEFHRLVVVVAADEAYSKSTWFQTVNVAPVQPFSGLTPPFRAQIDYPIPSDFYQLKRIASQINGADYRDMEKFTLAEESYLLSATPGFSGEPFKYRLIGKTTADGSDTGKIRLLPPPTGAITIQVDYIFGPTPLVNDTDQLDGFAGYEDYAIQFAIRSCCLKIEEFEKSDRAGAEMLRLKSDMLGQLRSRDASRPAKVSMTRDQWFGRGRRRGGFNA